jgi:hypothetical protein
MEPVVVAILDFYFILKRKRQMIYHHNTVQNISMLNKTNLQDQVDYFLGK